DSFCRYADFLIPDIKGLVVIQINRWVQSFRIQPYHLSQEFPGPGNGFMLEIISKGKVSQHFKKCAVAGSLSHILDISCTDTLLTGCHSPSRWNLCSGKVWLQWRHTGIDQKETFIIVRNQGKALHSQMSLALKKF